MSAGVKLDRIFAEPLEVTSCCVCGIEFGVPQHFLKTRRQRKDLGFYCPNGHSLRFTKSEADRLREELETERAALVRANEQIERERERRSAAERSLNATKGVLTRERKRTVAGVCPCCQRTFSQLARHMKTKHPQYTAEPPASEGTGA